MDDDDDDTALKTAGIALEKAVERGHPGLAQVLRIVVQAHTLVAHNAIYLEDDGNYDGEKLVEIVNNLAEGITLLARSMPGNEVHAPASSTWTDRARVMCADLVALHTTENGGGDWVWDDKEVERIRDEARALLLSRE